MKCILVGGGFTNLACALELLDKGHEVVLIEKNEYLGGLAAGFRDENWKWNLEHHYHHIFKSDKDIINLARRVGTKVEFRRVKSSFWDGKDIFQFDSLTSVMGNKRFRTIDRLRTLITIGGLKIWPYWKWFEKFTAEELIVKTMGRKIWDEIWKPLFEGKFHRWHRKVNATWFWARIHARSQKLGYFEGGFGKLVADIEREIRNKGGEIRLSVQVKKIVVKKDKVKVSLSDGEISGDKVIISGPAMAARQLIKEEIQAKDVVGLGAITMILAMKKSIIEDNTYWLNISDQNSPFLALVEHTNMIDRKYYGNDHIVYIGKYLSLDHELWSKTDEEILKIYKPTIKGINRNFSTRWIRKMWVFRARYAQSVFEVNHGEDLPTMELVKGKVYWCGMEHVYPWDRGTNYAVKWGNAVAKLMSTR